MYNWYVLLFPAAQHFYCRIAYTLTGAGCRSSASETMPQIGCAVHSRCLDALFQLRYETGAGEGLAVAEAEEGTWTWTSEGHERENCSHRA